MGPIFAEPAVTRRGRTATRVQVYVPQMNGRKFREEQVKGLASIPVVVISADAERTTQLISA